MCSVSFIGTHIRDNVCIKPMDCSKFHVTHYKHVTKGCVSNDIAMIWMHRIISKNDNIFVLTRICVSLLY